MLASRAPRSRKYVTEFRTQDTSGCSALERGRSALGPIRWVVDAILEGDVIEKMEIVGRS
jgi:hypothetical protein